MNSKDFARIFDLQVERCSNLLFRKAGEYATDDERLQNFKTAADLKHETPEQALSGMMAKHTVSIYDMIESGRDFDMAVWDEKITDHMNYLILLRAIVHEKAYAPDGGTLPFEHDGKAHA